MAQPISTAADYADALSVARRAKQVLFLLLLLILFGQLILFFVARFTKILPVAESPTTETSTLSITAAGAATKPVSVTSTAEVKTAPAPAANETWLHYLTGLTTFFGITLSLVLAFVLILLINIMLIGRLVGVARVTSAFIWCVFLIVLLFPWQAFLNDVNLTPDRVAFKLPGALYTWNEIRQPDVGAKFSNSPLDKAVLKWARFVVFPAITIIVLLVIQVKSNRGLRQAFGETPAEADDRLTGLRT